MSKEIEFKDNETKSIDTKEKSALKLILLETIKYSVDEVSGCECRLCRETIAPNKNTAMIRVVTGIQTDDYLDLCLKHAMKLLAMWMDWNNL